MKFTTFLALKYLVSPKKKIFSSISAIIAVLGIGIGVATLIVTLGIMSGFHHEIRKRLLSLYPHIVVSGNYEVDIKEVTKFKEIEDVSSFVYSQAILKSKNLVYTVVVKGIDFLQEQKVSEIKNIVGKEVYNLSQNEIFIGKELSTNLGLEEGDTVVMVLPTQIRTPFGNLPRTEKFVVKKIFRSGVYEYDSNLCYIDYAKAKQIFYDEETRSFNGVVGLGIKLKNDNDLNKVVEKLRINLGIAYKVVSWEQLNYNLFSALKLEKVMMIIVVSLIIIVACFVIVTNLIMLGIQKSKDIGILMSMGATKKEIKNIFFIQGIILNVSGIIFGNGLGLLLSWLVKEYQFVKLPKEVYYIDKIPVYLSFTDIGIVLLITIFVGIVASLYPAQKVSKFEPIEIIRYG